MIQEATGPDPDYNGTMSLCTLDLEILICTHNRVELLQRALRSLEACEIPKGVRAGIFVIANACSDGTHLFLENYRPARASLRYRWMVVPQPGKSHALNEAIPKTHGQLLAFVDDDHRVDTGFIRALHAAGQAHHDTELFCGRILPDWTGEEPKWVHAQGPYRIYPLPVPHFDLGSETKEVTPDLAVPGGGNLVLRKTAYEKVGPFRMDLGPRGHDLGGAEDIEWVKRAIAMGLRLRYLPNMLQYHYVDPKRLTLNYLMRKAYERSCSVTRLQPPGAGPSIPPYMIRKALGYLANALVSFGSDRRRFYLTRLAAALGEIKGARLRQPDEGIRQEERRE